MTAAVMEWPDPTRRGVRHTSRLSGEAARVEIYGLMLPMIRFGELSFNWSPVGTGGWASPDRIQAIVSLVSNPLEMRVEAQLPLRDQITFARHYLSLSVAEFARLVGVERPAIYAWMDGSNEPRPANQETINRLHRAALHVKERFGGPVGTLLRATTRDIELTLYDLLASAAEPAELDSTIETLAAMPRKPTGLRPLPERSEESLSRGRIRASFMAGRRLK